MIGFYQINLLDILIGLGIAWVVRWRWYWAPIAGIVVTLALNSIFDWLSYGDPFSHRQEMVKDALAFSAWGLLFCFLRPLFVMLRRGNF